MIAASLLLYFAIFLGGTHASFAQNVSQTEVKKFRVLVFPHHGPYTTPQGSEVDPTRVTIITGGTCGSFLAIKEVSQEWVPSGTELSTGQQFNLTLNQFDKTNPVPLYFKCTKPFVVKRVAPLLSYEYSGDFVVMATATQIEVINITDSETYLKGVVPSEVGATWPVESLKAQAVAARTFAWWSVLDTRKVESSYDLDDTVFYQVYTGNTQRTTITDAAADQTKNFLLKYDNQIIKAYFYADSGGYTEDASAVFGVDLPYCQAKPEQYDVIETSGTSEWQMRFKVEELSALLANANLIPSGVQVVQMNFGASDLTRSGRVARLHLLGSDGKKYDILGTDFRYAVKVRSTLFQISTSGNEYVFSGKGLGHGVGMAQIGAMEYASKLHWTFDQILKFYYTGVTLTND